MASDLVRHFWFLTSLALIQGVSHKSWKRMWLFVWVPPSAEKRKSLLKLAQLTHLEEAIFRAPGNGTPMIVAENAHYLRQIEPLIYCRRNWMVKKLLKFQFWIAGVIYNYKLHEHFGDTLGMVEAGWRHFRATNRRKRSQSYYYIPHQPSISCLLSCFSFKNFNSFSRHKNKGLHLFLIKICNCISFSWMSSYNLW